MKTREPDPVVIDGTNGLYVLSCRVCQLGGHGARRTHRIWRVVRFAAGQKEELGERSTLAEAKKLVATHEI